MLRMKELLLLLLVVGTGSVLARYYGTCDCDSYYSQHYNPCCTQRGDENLEGNRGGKYQFPIVPMLPPCTNYCHGSWACCDSILNDIFFGGPGSRTWAKCPDSSARDCSKLTFDELFELKFNKGCDYDEDCESSEKCCFTDCVSNKICEDVTIPAPPKPTAGCVCGKLNQGARIVGGTQAQVHEYPYQVRLKIIQQNGLVSICGGSIISTEWIITAAHCTEGIAASSIYVTVGEHDTTSTSETSVTKTIQVSMKVDHPDYNTITVKNDISLLRLSQKLNFQSDNKIAPICMPELIGPPDGTPLIVTGWGTTSSGSSLSNVLREVTVLSVSPSVCNNVYGTITSSQICAADTGKDSCQGDSGGPLVALNGNNYELTGVVSYGTGCAKPGFPGVYTKVISYESWIKSVTGTLDTCPKS